MKALSLNPRPELKALPWPAAAALVALSLAPARMSLADDQVPVPWNGIDIGGPSQAGASKADNGVFTLTGVGGELAGAGDRFHFVYQSLTGDCALVARVSAGGDPGGLTAAGIMARQALASTSDFVAVTLTPGHMVTSIYRGPCALRTASEGASAASPVWVKLVKRGTVVQSYMAADRGGTPAAWKRIGGSLPIPSGMIYVGLCRVSRAQGGTATFDHISLATGTLPLLDNGLYTITPAGAPDMVLAAAVGDVHLAPSDGSANQKWRLINKGGGLYCIQPFSDPSLALSVPGANSNPGSRVAVVADGGQNTQRWSIVPNSSGAYSLLPQFNMGVGLDDFGGNATPDAVIDIWNYDSADPHLQWTLTPAP